MATLLKVLNNLADIKSAGVLHFASELRGIVSSVMAAVASANEREGLASATKSYAIPNAYATAVSLQTP